ncbi:MAG TPA: TerC family protein [Ignavibacteria bacterium]|nr:TerC family protein [Ignavibacteria bacterium]HMR39371.1 TerC family protein [Ignavibacteria bacterium]
MLELFSQPDTYVSLLTLTFLEIVLGIDNIIFISILTGKLPAEQQEKGRVTGLILALFFRIGLLLGIAWIAGLVEPLITIFGFSFSGRDLILLGGGLFLMIKSVLEIHEKLEGEEGIADKKIVPKYWNVIFQIVLLDLVFSLDSVITAVGLVKEVSIMIIAIVISMIIMIMFAGKVSDFIHKHPTIKMLALSFLLMIGLLLFVEAFHVEVPKGYVYFAMAFSFLVEMLNIRMRKKTKTTS